MGDPIPFSTYLIGQIANNPGFAANFNFDADHGYGYLCWDWERIETETNLPRDEIPMGLKDGRGNIFAPPLTWSEGSENDNGPPAKWTRPDNVRVGENFSPLLDVKVIYPRIPDAET